MPQGANEAARKNPLRSLAVRFSIFVCAFVLLVGLTAIAVLQLVEAVQPEEHVTDDQQRPALADDLEGARDRAVLPLLLVLQHVGTVHR